MWRKWKRSIEVHWQSTLFGICQCPLHLILLFVFVWLLNAIFTTQIVCSALVHWVKTLSVFNLSGTFLCSHLFRFSFQRHSFLLCSLKLCTLYNHAFFNFHVHCWHVASAMFCLKLFLWNKFRWGEFSFLQSLCYFCVVFCNNQNFRVCHTSFIVEVQRLLLAWQSLWSFFENWTTIFHSLI